MTDTENQHVPKIERPIDRDADEHNQIHPTVPATDAVASPALAMTDIEPPAVVVNEIQPPAVIAPPELPTATDDDADSSQPMTAIRLVDMWLAENQARLDPADNMIATVSGKLGRSDIMAKLKYRKIQLATNDKRVKISKQDMETCLNHWLLEQKTRLRQEFVAGFDRYEANDAIFARFVRVTTGIENPLLALVLKQFIWQMKKKMFEPSYAVRYSIAPYFYSDKRGSGKSVSIGHLLSPLRPYIATVKAATLESDAIKPTLSSNYAILVDDVELKSVKDIGPIKSLITTGSVSYRRYFSHDVETLDKTVSLCFTSNRSVEEVFGEEGSSRRFVQFHWREVDGGAIVPEILTMNPMDFYNAVDHRSDVGPLDDDAVKSTLSVYQSRFTHLDAAQRFVLLHVYPDDGGELVKRAKISKSDLFTRFEKGNKKYPARRFYQRFNALCEEMGFKKHSDKHSYHCYYSQYPDQDRLDRYLDQRWRMAG